MSTDTTESSTDEETSKLTIDDPKVKAHVEKLHKQLLRILDGGVHGREQTPLLTYIQAIVGKWHGDLRNCTSASLKPISASVQRQILQDIFMERSEVVADVPMHLLDHTKVPTQPKDLLVHAADRSTNTPLHTNVQGNQDEVFTMEADVLAAIQLADHDPAYPSDEEEFHDDVFHIEQNIFRLQTMLDNNNVFSNNNPDKTDYEQACELLELDPVRPMLRTGDDPASPEVEILPHQVTAVKFFDDILSRTNLRGGILADSTGLGKTFTALLSINYLAKKRAKENAPYKPFLSLRLPTTSTVSEHVLCSLTSDDLAAGLSGELPEDHPNDFSSARSSTASKIILISYDLLSNEQIPTGCGGCVVLDEAHNIKDMDAAAFKATLSLDVNNYIFLTSAPINSPEDLQAYLRLLQPRNYKPKWPDSAMLDDEDFVSYYSELGDQDESLLNADLFRMFLNMQDMLNTTAADRVLTPILRLIQLRRTVTSIINRPHQYGGDFSVAQCIAPRRAYMVELQPHKSERTDNNNRVNNTWTQQYPDEVDEPTYRSVLHHLVLSNGFTGLGGLHHPVDLQERALEGLDPADHGLSFLITMVITDPWAPANILEEPEERLAYICRRSAKLCALAGICDLHIVKRKERMIVVTETPEFQWIVESFALLCGFNVASIKEDTPAEEREAITDAFNDPDVTEYQILISTGDLIRQGLNLHNHCWVMAIMDPPRSASHAQRLQTRLYRIGQAHPAYIYTLHNRHSVDEFIQGHNAEKVHDWLTALARHFYEPDIANTEEEVGIDLSDMKEEMLDDCINSLFCSLFGQSTSYNTDEYRDPAKLVP
ncbi:uncharacterized protein K452DRAFT_297556 [Aplosporella prunicola CBS 121167]|uniref:Helicase ATP-binding domain-containing protein n=1 Tax=Aplosporella prunicola CBS 121167 TaxID=1176127 RepID=A0A6A6BKF2_9PEZI|nr:uncharacterized protein K452DRAFT_297556 [Aplosporella prunicola CBS 121167]KAF2143051.1 hypothetical protein K452DRAFT_297556 [Aplosporella prunicola CBS 121167]